MGDSLLAAPETTAVFLDSESRSFHLARSRLAPKLGDDLVNLSETGGPDRVALGFKAA